MNKKTRRILYGILGSAFVFIAGFTTFNNSDMAVHNKYIGAAGYREYLRVENDILSRRDIARQAAINLAIAEQELLEISVPAPSSTGTIPAAVPEPAPVPSAPNSGSSTKAAPKTVKETSSKTVAASRGQATKQTSSSTISKTITVVSNGRTYSISAEERKLFARLVSAEAEGESYAGKLAVATVVINRVTSGTFPGSVTQVIMAKESGYYQFTPVIDGRINNPPSTDAVKAVDQVLGGYRSFSPKVMWFLNPKKSISGWIINKKTYYNTIGNHDFYY